MSTAESAPSPSGAGGSGTGGSGTVGSGTVGSGTVGSGTVGSGTVVSGTVGSGTVGSGTVAGLRSAPPHSQWHDWTELDAASWPKRVERNYTLVPTTCFNCEAACGLVAYIDQETDKVVRFEGNPEHPASRGRNCAKGPATINQVHDTERILYPLRRTGERGAGGWERISWDEALSDISSRIRDCDRRGSARRDHVSRRTSGRGRLHRTGADRMGHRRTQQPHQRVLVQCPGRVHNMDGPRPALVGLRERRSHLSHFQSS